MSSRKTSKSKSSWTALQQLVATKQGSFSSAQAGEPVSSHALLVLPLDAAWAASGKRGASAG